LAIASGGNHLRGWPLMTRGDQIERSADMTGEKKGVGEKMSESSDQRVPKTSPGKPALDENIKDLSDQEVSEELAEKMSESSSQDPAGTQKSSGGQQQRGGGGR
jgi:hypothetical protein